MPGMRPKRLCTSTYEAAKMVRQQLDKKQMHYEQIDKQELGNTQIFKYQ